jgi:ankyrin repeat protein
MSEFKNAFDQIQPSVNYTTLFQAIVDADWDTVIERLKSSPFEAETWALQKDYDDEVSWKRLPIHQACIKLAPEYVIKALIHAYPHGACCRDLKLRYPVHHAAVYGASLEVILLLLSACPTSVEAEDIFGKTPLMCCSCISLAGGDYELRNSLMGALSKGKSHYIKNSVLDIVAEGDTMDDDGTSNEKGDPMSNEDEALIKVEAPVSNIHQSNSIDEKTCVDEKGVSSPDEEVCDTFSAATTEIEVTLEREKAKTNIEEKATTPSKDDTQIDGKKVSPGEEAVSQKDISIDKEMRDSPDFLDVNSFQSEQVEHMDKQRFSLHLKKSQTTTLQKIEESNSQSSTQSSIMKIKELEALLRKEQEEKSQIMQMLNNVKSQYTKVESSFAIQRREINTKNQAINSLQNHVKDLEAAADSSPNHNIIVNKYVDERNDYDTASNFTSSFSIDQDVSYDSATICTLRAEVKERESQLSSALMRAKLSYAYV